VGLGEVVFGLMRGSAFRGRDAGTSSSNQNRNESKERGLIKEQTGPGDQQNGEGEEKG